MPMVSFVSIDKSIISPVPDDYKEVARYIGYGKKVTPDEQISELIARACKELFEVIKPQGVYDCFDLTINGDIPPACPRDSSGSPYEACKNAPLISFSDVQLRSTDLARNLKGCSKVYLMACTIGPQVDAFIRKNQITNPAYSAVLQSTGAMFIEKLVDYVNNEIKTNAKSSGLSAKPRYSPGYGDVPLLLQKDFFRLLPCTRIGLTLMDTLIMAPEKSVTAFVGVY